MGDLTGGSKTTVVAPDDMRIPPARSARALPAACTHRDSTTRRDDELITDMVDLVTYRYYTTGKLLTCGKLAFEPVVCVVCVCVFLKLLGP